MVTNKRKAFVDSNLHSKEFYNPNGKSHKDAIHSIPEMGDEVIYFERESALNDFSIGDKPELYFYNHDKISRGRFPKTSFDSVTMETQSLSWRVGEDEVLDRLIQHDTLTGSGRMHCIVLKRVA